MNQDQVTCHLQLQYCPTHSLTTKIEVKLNIKEIVINAQICIKLHVFSEVLLNSKS